MKRVTKDLVNRLVRVAKDVVNTLRYLCEVDKSQCLVVNAWMDLYGKEPVHRNLGDELNYYLIKELTGKRIYNYFNMRFLKIRNYCCIGSIVDSRAMVEVEFGVQERCMEKDGCRKSRLRCVRSVVR